jgi:hypothetical protein
MCKLILIASVQLLATLLYVQLKRSLLHSFEGTVQKVILLPTAHAQQVSYIANDS